jgi:sugar lactone lactonase YvrE
MGAMSGRLVLAGLLLSLAAPAPAAATGIGYDVQVLVPGSPFHGVHGLRFDKQGRLYAGTVVSQNMLRVDPKTGKVTTYIGAPEGLSDDMDVAPDGTVVYAAIFEGEVRAKKGNGPVKVLARGLTGVDGISFRKDGRLYVTTTFGDDSLYEIDLAGKKPPRKVLEKLGNLNAFSFGPDDKLYGPRWFSGEIVRVDVESGDIKVLASGFKSPGGVKIDSKGNLWVVDTAGTLAELDRESGARLRTVKLQSSLDNLVIDKHDHVYVSNMADNGIQDYDPRTGIVRQVVKGLLNVPGGIAYDGEGAGARLLVADYWNYHVVNIKTGAVTEIMRRGAGEMNFAATVSVAGQHVLLGSARTPGFVEVRDRASGDRIEVIAGFKQPYDALELPDGIVVAEYGTGNLVKVTGAPGNRTLAPAVTGLGGPVGLLPAGVDGVYVSEWDAGQISLVNPASGEKKVIASGLKHPEGMALAPDGRLIVAEPGARRIIAVNPKDGAVTAIATDFPMGLPAPRGSPAPYIESGVAVSPSGVIFAVSDIENAIYKLTPK